MSGLSVLQHLASFCRSPVLVLTGLAEHESAVAAIKLGAVDYKSKPLIGDELVSAVRALVSTSSGTAAPGESGWDYRQSHSVLELEEAARRVAAPTTAPLDFVLLTQAFRQLILGSRNGSRTGRASLSSHDKSFAANLLAHLATAISNGTLPSMNTVAEQTAVQAEEINRGLRAVTGLGYRDCRRILRVRPAIPDIAGSEEQMSQIAYRYGSIGTSKQRCS